MDETTDELIALLATRIGMIMEDASPVALALGNVAPDELRAGIEAIASATRQISALTEAMEALA